MGSGTGSVIIFHEMPDDGETHFSPPLHSTTPTIEPMSISSGSKTNSSLESEKVKSKRVHSSRDIAPVTPAKGISSSARTSLIALRIVRERVLLWS